MQCLDMLMIRAETRSSLQLARRILAALRFSAMHRERIHQRSDATRGEIAHRLFDGLNF